MTLKVERFQTRVRLSEENASHAMIPLMRPTIRNPATSLRIYRQNLIRRIGGSVRAQELASGICTTK